LIAADSPGRQEVIRNLLNREQTSCTEAANFHAFAQAEEKLMVTIAPLENGAWLKSQNLLVFDESCLFGQRANRRKRQRRFKASPEDVISNLTDLHATPAPAKKTRPGTAWAVTVGQKPATRPRARSAMWPQNCWTFTRSGPPAPVKKSN